MLISCSVHIQPISFTFFHASFLYIVKKAKRNKPNDSLDFLLSTISNYPKEPK